MADLPSDRGEGVEEGDSWGFGQGRGRGGGLP